MKDSNQQLLKLENPLPVLRPTSSTLLQGISTWLLGPLSGKETRIPVFSSLHCPSGQRSTEFEKDGLGEDEGDI